MKSSHKFGIDELNFIFTFAGFPIITTLLPFVPSITIRGLALAISLICLWKNRASLPLNKKTFTVFFVILILVDLRVLFECLTADPAFSQSRNMCLLFTYGVIFLPCLAFFSGYSKIDWTSTLYVLWVALFLTLINGALSIKISDNVDSARMDLNERQSTLVLGDFGGYEVLVALALFINNARKNFRLKLIIQGLLLLSMIIGLFDMAKAGSRGPVIALLSGFCMLFFIISKKQKIISVSIFAILIALGGLSLSRLESFAPILYYRFEAAFMGGGLSGRDDLLKMAFDMILSNPFSGGNPVIFLYDGGFTTYHNGFIDVCLSLGVLGFLVYLILILKLMIHSVKKRYAFNEPEYIFLVGMFGAMVARSLTGAGLFSNSTYTLIIGMASIYFAKPAHTYYPVQKNENHLVKETNTVY